jgi:hypothetical protein
MSDIIYTPPASSGGGTTINPTNNRIPVRSNATTFIDSVLENGTNYLYSNYGGYTGLGLDFANFVSYLGDWNGISNFTYIKVDAPNGQITLWAGDNNQTNLTIDDINQVIKTNVNGNDKGLNLDFSNNVYSLGDYNGITNNTSVSIDDANKIITLKTEGDLVLTGSSLQSSTAGGSSGEHLIITLNGNPYKIALLNP